MDTLIPDDVQAFLLNHIDTIAQLEALLLRRADPASEWTAEILAKRLYVSSQETATLLERLRADGFLLALQGEPYRYQYQPSTSELAHMVDQVAELYARYLIPITHLIHSKPRTRVQEFADAFKLRRSE
jgi:hypothetical protein